MDIAKRNLRPQDNRGSRRNWFLGFSQNSVVIRICVFMVTIVAGQRKNGKGDKVAFLMKNSA